MKKTLTILAMLLLINVAAQQNSQIGWMFINENTIDLDKQMHFTGSAFIATNTYFVSYQGKPENRSKAKRNAIVLTLLVGTVKELTDNKFSWQDMAYNAAGTFVATYTIDLMVNRAYKRHQKRQNAIAIANAFYD